MPCAALAIGLGIGSLAQREGRRPVPISQTGTFFVPEHARWRYIQDELHRMRRGPV
jgi:hypothetical protein